MTPKLWVFLLNNDWLVQTSSFQTFQPINMTHRDGVFCITIAWRGINLFSIVLSLKIPGIIQRGSGHWAVYYTSPQSLY